MSMRNSGRIFVLMLVMLAIAACAGVTPTPSPMADAAPEPQPQILSCGLSAGEGTDFTLACAEPTATPEPTATVTPTPTPSFYYLFCTPQDSLCYLTPWRIWWDANQKHLRCAMDVTVDTNGSKVTVLATIPAEAAPNGKPLSWVRTGWMSGSEVCEGWIEADRVTAAQ
jgi:ABC-type transport system substrate-binding protein